MYMNTKELGDLSSANFEKKGSKNIMVKNNSKLVGDEGEKMACEYLVDNGYKILGINYSIKYGKNRVFGEIDIIAKKRWNFIKLFNNDKSIHFIEVKTLFANHGFHPEEQGDEGYFPEDKVNYRKRNKLKKLCLLWLEKNKFPQNYPYQIDVIGILINPMVHKPKVSHFENVVHDQ